MVPIDRLGTLSYSASIGQIVVSVAVFEIFDFKNIFIERKPKSELNRK